jgi:2-polyprenyl-6-methoxyphenol hydroxylase-like FAD-dependent oxidoreductase
MEFDAVIVGGGPAGAACATALARGGARCLLIERSQCPAWKAGEVVHPEVQVPLRELGLWERFAARGYLRSAGTVSLWGGEVAERSAAADPYGGAFFVDRGDLEAMLLSAAAAAGARVVRGAPLRDAHRSRGRWTLAASCPGLRDAATTPLLIEATGRGRSLVGAGERARVDRLTALLAYPAAGESRDRRFSVEAVPDGWWYAAPLPEGKAVLAFLTDADLLPSGATARAAFFRQQVERSILTSTRFALANSVLDLRVAPAMSTIRRRLGGEGWVALGDAAATCDPLMGTGIAAALSKGLALARLLRSQSTAVAIEQYTAAERTAFDQYLRSRQSIYRGDRSWPATPFWRRRGEPSLPGARGW